MSAFNFNKVILGGRLTADPELKTTGSGTPVMSFSIAVNRAFKDKDTGEAQCDFIDCTAWRGTAEFISRYFRKGSGICVVGSLQKRKWQDQNGQTRYATEVVVDEATFVDGKNDGQGSAPAAQPAQRGNTQIPQNMPQYVPDQYKQQPQKFEEAAGDDDLPF